MANAYVKIASETGGPSAFKDLPNAPSTGSPVPKGLGFLWLGIKIMFTFGYALRNHVDEWILFFMHLSFSLKATKAEPDGPLLLKTGTKCISFPFIIYFPILYVWHDIQF